MMKPYSSYKDSGIEWLGKIPKDWVKSKLKFLGKIRYGLGQPPKELENGIPIIRATNVERGKIVAKDMVYVDPSDVPTGRNAILEENEIIVVRSGAYTADSALVTKRYAGAIAGYDMVITPTAINAKLLSFGLLSQYILQNQLFLERMRAAQPHLNAEELGETIIICPPLPEQQAIADFLDRKTTQIDALIEKKKRQIDLLQEQRTALINHAVTKGLNPDVRMKDSGVEWLGEIPSNWIVSKLKYVCYVSDGNHGEEYPEETDFTDEANGVPFIRVTEFEGFNITRNGILYITKEKNESMRKGGLQENDILFVNRGSIGKMALVSKEFEGANLNSQIAYFRVTSSKMNYKYLLYFLYSGTFQKMISSLIHGGALQQLPLKRIIGLEVLCPPLEDQIEIVNYLEKITTKADLSIKSISKEIELVQEYRTALISEAVTGKIDVRTAV
jgi:type I restriction enzyme, S subunit